MLDPVAELLELRGDLQGELGDLGRGAAADPRGVHADPQPTPTGPGQVADRRQVQGAVDLLGLAEERRGVADATG